MNKKIPVGRLSPELQILATEELKLVGKIRMIVELMDCGADNASIFSKEDEKTLEEIKTLSLPELLKLLKDSEDRLAELQLLY